MRGLAILGLLALAGCGGKPEPAPAAAAPVAAAPPGGAGDYSKPIDASGTDPFWALTIRGATLTLTRPEGPALTATAPGAVIQPHQSSWTGKTADGRELKVTLYVSPCSDGMSDRVYTYAAEVVPPGESPLSGCADKTSALSKPAG
jgi:uncharacterized membrane protein